MEGAKGVNELVLNDFLAKTSRDTERHILIAGTVEVGFSDV